MNSPAQQPSTCHKPTFFHSIHTVTHCSGTLLAMRSTCPVTSQDRPLGFQKVQAPRNSRQLAHEGGLPCQLYAPATSAPNKLSLVLISAKRPKQNQGHSVARRIKSMKKPTNPIDNQTRDLSDCKAECQPTASLHNPITSSH